MAYIIVFTVIFLALGFLVRFQITRIEKKNINKFKKHTNFESVSTESPIDDPFDEAYERGIESITTRFSWVRRIFYPFLLTVWAFGVGIPQLDQIPSIYSSVVITVITVIVGIAAKPYFENLIAGMVISFSNSIRIGDTVEIDGQYGSVEEISLTHVTLKVWDWRRYIVPNNRLLGKEFLNYTLHDKFVWSKVSFTVSRKANLALVEEMALQSVQEAQHFNNQRFEKPAFWVMELKSDCAECWVVGWVSKPKTAWQLTSEVRSILSDKLNEAGIESNNFALSTVKS